jgi:hypothetical protein
MEDVKRVKNHNSQSVKILFLALLLYGVYHFNIRAQSLGSRLNNQIKIVKQTVSIFSVCLKLTF